ncbi:MAG: hypothetical protein JXA58_08550 [Dehalococcoidia bacterium]|nr:hypothetical protein [Dehalococcoidia bacterium]
MFGWDVTVLTSTTGALTGGGPAVEIPESAVIRTRSLTLGEAVGRTLRKVGHQPRSGKGETSSPQPPSRAWRLLSAMSMLPFIDKLVWEPVGWYCTSVRTGLRLVHRQHPNLIYSSAMPVTSHFVALTLHILTGVRWVAEFRDLWVNPYLKRGRLRDTLELVVEKSVLRLTSGLVAVSEHEAVILRRRHGKPTATVLNAFDPAPSRGRMPLTAGFTLTYTGILVGPRNPHILLEALGQLRDESRLASCDFALSFYGSDSPTLRRLVLDHGLRDLVGIYPRVSRDESLLLQRESTVLLIVEPTEARALHVYTGKVYEYLDARRPILAIGPRGGVLDQLLQETHAGVLTDNGKDLKAILRRWIEEWRDRQQIQSWWGPPTEESLRPYTREEQTRVLSRFLRHLLCPAERTTKPDARTTNGAT